MPGTFFPDYDTAKLNSEMLRQGAVAAAHAAHTAATDAATQDHHNRLAAAGLAFGVSNSAPGDGNSEKAIRWLGNGK